MAAAVDEPAADTITDGATTDADASSAANTGATGEMVAEATPGEAADEGATEDGDAASIDDPLPTSADPCTEPVDFSAIASDLTGDGYPTGLRFL